MTQVQTLNVGKITLPVNTDEAVPFLPHVDTRIVGSEHELETIALGIRDNLPVLLIGDTGTGKTSFIRYLAMQTRNNFRRLNLNGSTTADELVGHYVVDDKASGMRWVDGVMIEAMKHGYWLLLDELNAGLPEVLFALQSVLDDDRFYVVAEHEGEIVKPHENFRIFATMNPSLDYAGTRDLNKALLSRFPVVLQTNYPNPLQEVAIIKMHVPSLDEQDATVMVKIAEDIRKGKKNNSIGFICSTRELINWAKLTPSVGFKEAAELAVLNKCELDTDKKTLEDIFKMQFGKWEKKQVITFSEIEAQLEAMQKKVKDVVAKEKEKDKTIAAYEIELEGYRTAITKVASKKHQAIDAQ